MILWAKKRKFLAAFLILAEYYMQERSDQPKGVILC